jgi:hypothetical protein
MIDIGQLEAFLAGYLGKWLVSQTHTEDIVRQMSFGLIQVYPPSGEPSLTSQLNNIVFQIQSLREHLDTANTEMISQNVDILAAIAALPDGSGPVTLPTIPPTGYGVDDGSIAGAVWAHNVGGYTQAAGDLMLDAGMLAVNLSAVRAHFPSGKTKYFTIRGTWFSTSGADTDRDYPTFPLANILSDDTLSVFLERESGFNGWTANGDGTWQVAQDDTANDYLIDTTITDAEFLVLRDGVAAGATALCPPVWPGADLVTLGTPVDLDDEVTITDDLDGVLISILSVPDRLRAYSFDGELSYRSLGALTFFTDSGDNEPFQVLGFSNAIFCPKSMARAAGCKLRLLAGVVGTAIPWTRTT